MIVLDTCAIIWLVLKPQKLSKRAERVIEDAIKHNEAYYSAISHWEIAWAIHHKRIEPKGGFEEFFGVMDEAFKLQEVEITPIIAQTGVQLPSEINSDPADRIIAATSLILDAPVVTADKNLRKSTVVKTIW